MPFGARLSVAGDRAVVVIASKSETTHPRKGPMVVQAWQRRADVSLGGGLFPVSNCAMESLVRRPRSS